MPMSVQLQSCMATTASAGCCLNPFQLQAHSSAVILHAKCSWNDLDRGLVSLPGPLALLPHKHIGLHLQRLASRLPLAHALHQTRS